MAVVATVATLAGMSSALLVSAGTAAAQNGTITGEAFRDFNANGQLDTTASTADPAVDVGIAGVTVNAYDSTGTVVGTATTGSNGDYTLTFSNSASTQVRVEFTPPTGFDIGPVGTGTTGVQSGGNVQFVSSGGTANVGLVAPGDFCDSSPTVVIPCIQGAINQQDDINTLAPTNEPALLSYAYTTSGDESAADVPGSTSTVVETKATVAQIGSTWGSATYNVNGGSYALEATYFKRFAELGDGGAGSLGAIYITNLSSATPNGTAWTTIPNAGTDPRIAAYGSEAGMTFNQWLDDTPGYEDADEIGLGGMSMAPGEKDLYVVNLNDRNLYSVPVNAPGSVGGEPSAGTPTAITLPLSLPGASVGCTQADVRPMAVQAEVGAVYVGLTCTGPAAANLRGYIYKYDTTTGTFGSAPILEIPFSGYARGYSYQGETLSAAWNPWTTTTFESTGTSVDWASYPQPLVSGISFDAYGNMTVAVKDRNGDQVGSHTPPPGATTPIMEGVQAGDLLLACTNSGGTFTLESNGSCTSATEGTTLTAGGEGNWNTAGTGGVGDGNGPGGGEFYFQHYDVGSGGTDGGAGTAAESTVPAHDHIPEGGVAQVPGFADVISTALDPISADIPGGTSSFYETNGTLLQSNKNGGDTSTAGGTILASANSLDSENQASFGKANGLGDVAVLCSSAPVEIGNRVWIDTNGNGIQDPGEPGVAGVTVTLKDSGGTVVATTTTDANGDYLFNDSDVTGGLVPSASYTISVDKASDFATGGPLAGYEATTEGAGTDTAANSKGVAASPGATAAATAPPVGADLDYDFGFEKTPTCAVGDTVFLDTNGNGTKDSGETPLSGVQVELFTASGQKVTTQADGTTALTNPVTTGTNGLYLFDNLACGTYYETFTPPAGSGLRASPQVAPAIGSVDSQPDGTGKTADFTLGASDTNNEPSSSYTTQTVTAQTINPTIDAGFQPANCSVGDTVFVDTNGNGTKDTGEQPLPGVTVVLYDASTNLPVTSQVNGQALANNVTTDTNGHYLFDNLPCGGTYYETFTPPAGYTVTQAVAPSLTANDSQPNSQGQTPNFTLTYTASTITTAGDLNETSADYTVQPVTAETINPSEDAGYTPPSCAVGSTVFLDTNGNGAKDTGETPLSGVTVTIFNSDGSTPTLQANGTAFVNHVTTGADGSYLFDDLPCGSYYETFTPPTGDGYRFTAQVLDTTSLTTVDSEINGTSGTTPADQTPVFTLGATENLNETAAAYHTATGNTIVAETINPTVDAGFQPANCAVGSTVFVDTNLNGTQDNGEPGLANVQVTLYTSGGTKVLDDVNGNTLTNPATTDSTGHYYFDNLPCGGTYYETFTAPAGYTPTTQVIDSGSFTAVDSEPSTTTGKTPDFTLSYTASPDTTSLNEPSSDYTLPNGESALKAETINPTVDAGFKSPACAVGSTVFLDSNGNGVQDTGEPALANAQVELFTSSGVKVTTQLDGGTLTNPATTDTNGQYLFDDIACGSYYETFTPPAGSGDRVTTQVAGSLTAVDSTPYGTSATGSNPADQTPVFTLGATESLNETAAAYTAATGKTIIAQTINPTVDAGFQPANCAVGSQVFVDTNGNGTKDGAEQPLQGVTVVLYDASTNLPVTSQVNGQALANDVTTDANGYYVFDNLPCGGTYYETFTPPAGYNRTVQVAPSLTAVNSTPSQTTGQTANFTLTYTPTTITTAGDLNETSSDFTPPTGEAAVKAETINPGEDAGYTPPSCAVGSTVFVDTNGNGTQDTGETPLSGVTVTIFNSDGSTPALQANGAAFVNHVTTGANGQYLFDNLPCGSYYETFTPPAGSGLRATTQVLDTTSLTTVDSETYGTSATGSHPADQTPTFTLGSGPAVDESAAAYHTATGNTIVAETINPTVDAGFQPANCAVGSTVFVDTNLNGTQDNGEPGLANVQVTLYTSGGTKVLDDVNGNAITNPATTDSTGHYYFDNLACGGTYYETFTPPAGDTATKQVIDSGSFTAVDSEPSTTTGKTPDFTLSYTATPDTTSLNEPSSDYTVPTGATLPGGETALKAQTINPTVDAGFQTPACAVGSTVFVDTNGNGVQNTGEAALQGAQVELFTSSGVKVTTQLDGGTLTNPASTDSAGHYLFDDIACGSYYETFTPPAGSGDRVTTQVAGSLTAVDSTPYGTSATGSNPADQTPVFTLGTGQSLNETAATYTAATGNTIIAQTINPAVDAGFQPANCAVGSTVFIDTNGNGVQDTGEPGLANVQVTLYNSNGTKVTTEVDGTTSLTNPVTTDAKGYYVFDNLPCGGSYYETFSAPAGFTDSPAVAASLTAVDSQPNSLGQTPTFTLTYTPTTITTAGDLNEKSSDYTPPTGEPAITAETINPAEDAGFTPPSCAVGSTVFIDTNGNGTQDTGESPLSGVTVTILNSDGSTPTLQANGTAFDNQTTTNSSGQYLFDDLPCGSYYETFTPPAGSGLRATTQVLDTTSLTTVDSETYGTSATGSNPADQTPIFTLGGTQNLNETSAAYHTATGNTIVAKSINPTVDAGFQPANCAVGSTVFVDTNLNGTQDAGEPGLANVQVTLYTSNGTKVLDDVNGNAITNPVTTDSTGHYYFDNLACGGSYYETFTPPAGGYSPTVTQSPSLSAVNSTPSQSTGKTPVFTLAYTSTVDDTTLNEPSSGYTIPTGATLPGGESALKAQTINPTVDAGFQAPACAVGSTVFLDTNGNGVQDTGEAGLANARVELFTSGGVKVTTQLDGGTVTNPATTDANGHYLFDDIACGSYYETFTPPAGSNDRPTTQVPGSLTAVDSTPYGTSATGSNPADQTPVFSLGSGGTNEATSSYTSPFSAPIIAQTINPAVDAGFQPANCAAGSTVFTDTNGNGTQNTGEPGLAGITVTLYTSGGTKVTSQVNGSPLTNPATTDSSGHYLFDDLPCGSYYETFSVPAGYTVSPSVNPSLTSVNSQPGSSGQTPVFTLGAGSADNEPSSSFTGVTATAETINPTVDAGLIPPSCAVGDIAFIDNHSNGIGQDGDTPLSGVTVTLYNASTGSPVTTHLNGTPLINPVTTNSAGLYLFDTLACGTYYETFTPPTGYSATKQVTPPSSITAIDSQPVQSTGKTPNFTLGLGATDNESSSSYSVETVKATLVNPTEDAGFVVDGNVTGTVFLDTNKNGTQNGGEPGIGGITVSLINPKTGATVATTKTNSSGQYDFADVPPGTYDVDVAKPDGDTFTTVSAGTVTVPTDGTGIFNAGAVPATSTPSPTVTIPTAVPAGGGFFPTHRSGPWLLLILMALLGLILTGWGGLQLALTGGSRRYGYAGWPYSTPSDWLAGLRSGIGYRRKTRWRT